MDIGALEGVFCRWVESMNNADLSVQHTHSLDNMPDGMVLATVLTTIKPDEQRRARARDRSTKENLPLAHMRYVVAISGAAKAGQAEQALLSVLMDVERQPEIKVLPDSVSETWWLAHGRSPLPSIQLEARITEIERAMDAPLVEKHSISMSGLKAIQGRVVWQTGQPINGAKIQLESSQQTVVSDGRGYFRLNIPSADVVKDAVRVQARSEQQTFAVADVVTSGGEWLLRMAAPGK